MATAISEINGERELYLPHFERIEAATLRTAAWFSPMRRAAFAHFSELGFPTTEHEEWRYTNVAPLASKEFEAAAGDERVAGADVGKFLVPGTSDDPLVVLVNGRFSPRLSRSAALPAGVIVESLAEAMERHRAIVEAHLARHARCDRYAFTALNTALMEDGAFVHVPRGVVLERPIHVLHVSTSPGRATTCHPRNLVVLEESSQATIVESYVGLAGSEYFANAVTELVAKDNAVLDHYKVVRESEASYHLAMLFIHQHRSSTVSSHTLTLHAGLARNDIHVVLDGDGGDCTLNGLYMLSGEQHVDNHLVVEHVKPHCFSREFFKGILDGSSKGIFSGRIVVWKGAQKTDAKQTNRSLLLSEAAQVESKPQLEIFADDVKCTHGATIGQVNQDAVFYLRSRGMTREAARSLLVHAFAKESIEQIRLEPLRRQMDALLVKRLPEGERLGEATG